MKKLKATLFAFCALFLLAPALSYAQRPVSEDTLLRIDSLYAEALAYLTSEGRAPKGVTLGDSIKAQIEQLRDSGCRAPTNDSNSIPCRLKRNLDSLLVLVPSDLASSLFDVEPVDTESPLANRILGGIAPVLTAIGKLSALNRYLNRYQGLFLEYQIIRADVRQARNAADRYRLLQHVDSLFRDVGREQSRFEGGPGLAGFTTDIVGIGGLATFRSPCPFAGDVDVNPCLISLYVLYASKQDLAGGEFSLGKRMGDWGVMPGVLFIGKEDVRWDAVGTLYYFGSRGWTVGASFSTVRGIGIKMIYNL